MNTRLLINGDMVAGAGAEQAVLNPHSGETLVKIREASVDQIHQAVTAAAAAFKTWGQTTPQ